MRMLTIFCLIVGLCGVNTKRKELDPEWDEFKETFYKKYSSEDEERRRLIWEDNIDYINDHNKKAEDGSITYRLGISFFADLTPEEIAERYTGLGEINDAVVLSSEMFVPPINGNFSENVNWVKAGMVTAAKDQKEGNCSWAFSTVGALEANYALKKGDLVSLSDQNLIDCVKTNQEQKGGLMSKAFEYIIDNAGIATEDSYPYTGERGKCRYDPKNRGATISSMERVPKADEQALKAAVATIGAVSVAINSRPRDFAFFKSGVYSNSECNSGRPNYAAVITGYGTKDGEDYWMVKNSWGFWWGINGHIFLAMNKNMCGIADYAIYPII